MLRISFPDVDRAFLFAQRAHYMLRIDVIIEGGVIVEIDGDELPAMRADLILAAQTIGGEEIPEKMQ
ncbi:hypothetical protein [Bradyrhizobium sp. S3.7.6]